MKVSIDELKQTTKKTLLKQGYDETEADTILDVLMYAQLRGNNQGVVKLIGKGMANNASGDIEIIKESPVSAWLNAHQNQGMVVMNQASDLAIKKAKVSGIAIIGVKGINTSSGAIGYYARKIAQNGLVAFAFSGYKETVAPAGAYQPIFGTNPLAIALPGKNNPLVFDMATSAMALFGVVEASTVGRPLPEGVAYDSEGNPTTNAAKAMDGALLTFDKGGHKGSGLSMMIQALTGPLIGAAFAGIGDESTNWGGHLIIAFDPEMFAGLEATEEGVNQLIAKVKGAKTLPGVGEILVPSERGDKKYAEAINAGVLEIEDNVWVGLQKAAV